MNCWRKWAYILTVLLEPTKINRFWPRKPSPNGWTEFSLVWAYNPLLGRPAQPGGDESLAGGHRGGGLGRHTGPAPMTVGAPRNVPYVITGGAMTNNHTPADPSDDRLTSFSAAGPTAEGMVKPEVVAPGGFVRVLMDDAARIARDHPEFHDGGLYFTVSGTSQAAAVVSGVAALLLQADPSLTPNDVKCRLMATARTTRRCPSGTASSRGGTPSCRAMPSANRSASTSG